MLKGLKAYFKGLQEIDDQQLAFNIYKTTEFEFLVVSLITEGQPTSQLEKGIDSDGNILGFYSVATEVFSGGRKKAGDRYTLKDTAFYYNSHEVIAELTGFTIVADTNKDGKDFLRDLGLEDQKVINLTDGNLQIVIDEFKEFFSDAFREFLDKNRFN